MRHPLLNLKFCLFFIFPHIVPAVMAASDPQTRLQENIEMYRQAVMNGDSLQIAEACYLIGKRHIILNNFSESHHWLQKALDLRTQQKEYESIGKIYLRMEEIQFILRHPQDANRYAKLAFLNFRKIKSMQGYMSSYNALGASHFLAWEIYQNDTLSRHRSSLHHAIRYYNKALKVAQYLGSAVDIGQDYRYLSLCWAYKDKKKCLAYQKKAWAINTRESQWDNSVELATDIGNEYLRQGDLEQGKEWFDKAEAIISQAQIHQNGLRFPVEMGLSRYFELTGKWKSALLHRERTDQLRDGLFEQYRSQAVEGTRAAYETRLKEVELNARHNEINLLKQSAETKNRFMYAMAVLFLLTGAASLLYGILYSKYKALSRYNELLIKEQSHRTKNNLQSICNLLSLQLYKMSDSAASKILEESIFRVEAINMIHHQLHQYGRAMFIDLPKYLSELIESILKIYKMDYVFTTIEIDPLWLHAEQAVPLGLIVNELTTNACKYGLAVEFPKLSVSCQCIDGQVLFHFKDNGPGFDSNENHVGFGLELIVMLSDQLHAVSKFDKLNGCLFELKFNIDAHHILAKAPGETRSPHPI